jgi:hypothetical protein
LKDAGQRGTDVLVFNKGGRDFRMDRLERGEAVPREFFYGFPDLIEAGIRARMQSSAGAVPGPVGWSADMLERALVRALGLGVRPLSARLRASAFADAKVVMSYTDGFSLSLGLARPALPAPPVLMGGFHALADMEDRVPAGRRALARGLIARALAGLDHAFFFSPADHQEVLRRYALPPEKATYLNFGVDTEFWRPEPDAPQEDFVVAVGQDPNRDFDLLAAAPGGHPTRIVTRRTVALPPGSTHVSIGAGDFFGSDSMSDEQLRRLYNTAAAVIVPLKDVFQATGTSVSLQAMACGRPVIISNIKGIWAPDALRDGENCLLVPPGDAAALGAAIGRIRADGGLAARIGKAARELVVTRFGLQEIGGGTVALARKGLALFDARGMRA